VVNKGGGIWESPRKSPLLPTSGGALDMVEEARVLLDRGGNLGFLGLLQGTHAVTCP
jgi:hypothetical protein